MPLDIRAGTALEQHRTEILRFTRKALAKKLDVSLPTLNAWVKKGIPLNRVPEVESRLKIDLRGNGDASPDAKPGTSAAEPAAKRTRVQRRPPVPDVRLTAKLVAELDEPVTSWEFTTLARVHHEIPALANPNSTGYCLKAIRGATED